MDSSASAAAGDASRLERCIRDLAALTALPAICIGCFPDEAVNLVVDALPTALAADLILLTLPGSPVEERASLDGKPLSPDQIAALVAARSAALEGASLRVPDVGELWFFEAEIPVGAERGRLLAARGTPLDPATDRVLVRTAANLVGTIVASARELETARRKDEFLAVLGHELRTPLAPILTAAELLQRHPVADRERSVIDRHSRHLARLVDDLLDISRVTRGNVELKSEHVSLASVITRSIEMVSPAIQRSRHTLIVGDAGPTMLKGDPVRLAQVFANLLINANKFTAAGGRIEVSFANAADSVRVTVRDNGRGIAPDALGRIFEPFVHIGAQRDDFRGGLGLGLAIVRDLVRRHGGTVSAESGGVGRGAVFTVELPSVVPVELPAPSAEPAPTTTRDGVRVLVVDDNTDVAELLSEALADVGFQTAIAFDARSALDTWRSFQPHAAVLDIGLPEVDGYELAKAVRDEHGPAPTLIAATGYGRQQDRLRAADAGFDCHFVKPVSVRDLVVTLDERVIQAGVRPVPRA